MVPSLTLDNKFVLDISPEKMDLNCTSSRVSLLDKNGILKLLELESNNATSRGMVGVPEKETIKISPGTLLDIEKKDIWGIKWSIDNPNAFAIMEKTRLLIFDHLECEDPVTSSACNTFDLR